MRDELKPLARRSLLQCGTALCATAAFGATARADDAAPATPATAPSGKEANLSHKGKTIPISVSRTDHFIGLKAYR